MVTVPSCVKLVLHTAEAEALCTVTPVQPLMTVVPFVKSTVPPGVATALPATAMPAVIFTACAIWAGVELTVTALAALPLITTDTEGACDAW
jgi:hypothetical protein